MKRKALIASGLILALLAGLCLVRGPTPKVHATFPDVLSEAQRSEIPAALRKEARRIVFANLKQRRFKAAWAQYRFFRSQSIIAVAYQPEDQNRIWVYLGTQTTARSRPTVSATFSMTNEYGHWRISN